MSTLFSSNLHHQPQFLTVWTEDICSEAILFPSYYLITGCMTARLQLSQAEKTGFTTLARFAASAVTTWGITVAAVCQNSDVKDNVSWNFVVNFHRGFSCNWFLQGKRVFQTFLLCCKQEKLIILNQVKLQAAEKEQKLKIFTKNSYKQLFLQTHYICSLFP